MNAFLITTPKGALEFKSNFEEVQTQMNELEQQGIVSNVKVQKFVDHKLVKELVYDYNGESWEKR